MVMTVSHALAEETPEAKARWFQSLTLSERMDLLCIFTDLVLGNNPLIVERKDAEPIAGRVRVISKTVASKEDLIDSKRAAGRNKDLEDVRMLEIDSGSGEA